MQPMDKIRFFKASRFYSGYLDSLYENSPGLKTLSYVDQYRRIVADCFGWADFWKINLEDLGTYQVEDVIVNAEHLQKQWAKEHHVKYSEDNWALEILAAQIAEFQPEIFFAHDFCIITPQFRQRIRHQVPSINMIIGWDGIALNNTKSFVGCDLMLCPVDFVAKYYRQHGMKAMVLPFGFEKSILDKLTRGESKYGTSFVGSIMLSRNGHNQRLKLLAELSRKTDIELWAFSLGNWKTLLQNQLSSLKHWKFQEFWDVWQISKHNHCAAFGLKMYQILADSKITINCHIDSAGNNAGNLRLWEATGTGTCMVTDFKETLHEYFKIDQEVVVYRTAEECIEKVKYLLSHDKERSSIATAGQKRTLENYTFANRMESFSKQLLAIYR